MKAKPIILALFALLCLAQLYVPLDMMLGQKRILEEGQVFKFKTRPIDPYDPFRGRYVVLRFEQDEICSTDTMQWERDEKAYLELGTDSQGYARIVNASRKPPAADVHYIKAEVRYHSNKGCLRIDYPFDRYYIEESKAPEAELVYRQAQRDTSQQAYALVSIKDGEAALKDVMIDGISIKDYVSGARLGQ